MWCTCVHSEDITIECIFVSAILNLSHRIQQSLPITRASKMASSVRKTMFRTEWTKQFMRPLWRGQTLRGNIEVIHNIIIVCPSKNLLDVHIYTETAFKDNNNTKWVAFLELNGINKSCPVSVRFLLGIFCYLMGHFPNSWSAKSSTRSLETRDWREFSPFMRQEYKKSRGIKSNKTERICNRTQLNEIGRKSNDSIRCCLVIEWNRTTNFFVSSISEPNWTKAKFSVRKSNL